MKGQYIEKYSETTNSTAMSKRHPNRQITHVQRVGGEMSRLPRRTRRPRVNLNSSQITYLIATQSSTLMTGKQIPNSCKKITLKALHNNNGNMRSRNSYHAPTWSSRLTSKTFNNNNKNKNSSRICACVLARISSFMFFI